MKSVVELDIEAPQDRVAALMFDPLQSTTWMDDLERIEPIDGVPGMLGSRYRMVPKEGDMIFVVTVVARDLPNEGRLHLDGSNSRVDIRDRFIALSPLRSRLISEEKFRFTGFFPRVLGFFARSAIKKAHRKHMESFKRFAERAA